MLHVKVGLLMSTSRMGKVDLRYDMVQIVLRTAREVTFAPLGCVKTAIAQRVAAACEIERPKYAPSTPGAHQNACLMYFTSKAVLSHY